MDSRTSAVLADQRLDALGRANRVRQARAQLKRRIAADDLTASQAVLLHQWEVEGMPVDELITSQRHWGAKRCRRLLLGLSLKEGKTIGSMTERQRLALAAELMRPSPASVS
ncbi:MAG: hypothetical protein QOK25_1089 [Thermoleophilaceae bacterium]|jgi:hypothetical protein|nr:hypothetical protein [Thermoleophilaceae bacterium]